MTAQQLKNAILQMAVQGKLVPQDPSDEPASVLLERIRKEKEALIKAGKIKRDKKSSVIFRGASRNIPYAFCEQIGKEIRDISDEIPLDIPDSWEWVHLDHIAVSDLGKTLDKSKNTGNYQPYLCSINVYWNGIDLSKVKEARFEDSELPKYLLKKGDLLICEGGEVGRCCVWDSDMPMYYQNALHRVRFFSGINPYYFKYLIELYKGIGIIEKHSKGVTIKHLVQKSLNEIYFPLPPLAEQKRIVAKIEELLPFIEKYGKAEEHLTALNTTFPEALKKSILQEAVQGRLVPQNPDDEPASVLLERIRAEKQALIKAGKIKRTKETPIDPEEVPFEIPEEWCWCRLGICLDVRDGTHDTPKYVQEGIPLVTSKNLCNGHIDFSTAKFISFADHEAISQRSKVDDGDILFAMIGSIGNPVLYHGNDIFSIKNMALFKAVVNGLNMEYVYQYLLLAQLDMKKYASGGVQSFVSLSYLRNYLIPVPPLAEQKRIVAKIEELIPMIDRLTKR